MITSNLMRKCGLRHLRIDAITSNLMRKVCLLHLRNIVETAVIVIVSIPRGVIMDTAVKAIMANELHPRVAVVVITMHPVVVVIVVVIGVVIPLPANQRVILMEPSRLVTVVAVFILEMRVHRSIIHSTAAMTLTGFWISQ